MNDINECELNNSSFFSSYYYHNFKGFLTVELLNERTLNDFNYVPNLNKDNINYFKRKNMLLNVL